MEEMRDLISREALKKATKELYNETLDAIVKFGIEKVYELINNAPIVDLVSPTIKVNISEETKQKLIEELQKPHKLLVLPEPEVTFERPQGEWITEYDYLKCPFCGMTIDDEVHYLYPKEYGFNYCPNCGAKLEGGEV